MRFRLRPVSESKVEADGEGMMTPVPPEVEDCCCTESDDSAEVDEGDDDCRVVVGRLAGGLSPKANPTTRATTNTAPNATQRSRFKASEIVGYGVILGA